ncbi:hypothetical protein CROQUDRAFT_719751 [Cronartium quercuum f. sp. fusiforme G11]|uniref:Uncharacterized protein n=1 Tax=Cronartium quercuum f. sp. fusiforme G11 TaxID=708437 RepID=A0A9P6NWC7_9BASI|nr:hypothetical protein CROQUDRAFT_719751 [Cronartium quercuum f. sp. fusiforme G11]
MRVLENSMLLLLLLGLYSYVTALPLTYTLGNTKREPMPRPQPASIVTSEVEAANPGIPKWISKGHKGKVGHVQLGDWFVTSGIGDWMNWDP